MLNLQQYVNVLFHIEKRVHVTLLVEHLLVDPCFLHI